MSLDDTIRATADAYGPEPRHLRVVTGTIDHVVPNGTAHGNAAFVNVGGSIFQAVYYSPYAPTAGDVVDVLLSGGSPRIIGAIAAGSTAISGNINLPGTTTVIGNVDLGPGGLLTVEDVADNPLVIEGTRPDGRVGFETLRANGISMLQSYAVGFLGLSYTQITDTNGYGVIYDDPIRGGIGRPRVPLVQWAALSAPGTAEPQVTSSSWTTTSLGAGYDQAARGVFTALVTSSAADTTGNAQIIDQTGAVIGASQPIAANTTTLVTFGPTTLPNWGHGAAVTYQLQVQCTAGTGWVSARGMSAWGCAASDTT